MQGFGRESGGRGAGGARRGAAYVYVLMVAAVMMTIGLALVSVNRVNARTITQEGSITRAQALARAAVEHALQTIASNAGWQGSYPQDTWSTELSLGGGTISFRWTPDGDATRVRLYGRGKVGGVQRIYSVQIRSKAAALDVLRTAAHAAGSVSTSATVTVKGGPLSSNATLTVGALCTLAGSAEAPVIVNAGTITGTSTITGAKAMPSSAIFDTLKGEATTIAFASITDGKIQSKLLSPTSNPYGATNAKGIYFVQVPSGSTLTIRQSRLVGTLLVELKGTAKFTTSNAYLIEPADPSRPALVVKAEALSTVDFNGFNNTLSEASAAANFNAPGTPYPWSGGSTDTDVLDNYPTTTLGVVHVISPITVTTSIGSNFSSNGVVISEGPMSLGSNAVLTADPALLSTPPTGYTGSSSWTLAAGTWRWEKDF